MIYMLKIFLNRKLWTYLLGVSHKTSLLTGWYMLINQYLWSKQSKILMFIRKFLRKNKFVFMSNLLKMILDFRFMIKIKA